MSPSQRKYECREMMTLQIKYQDKFVVMNSELRVKGFICRKLMLYRMINKLINSILCSAEKQWNKSREGILNFYVTDYTFRWKLSERFLKVLI